MLGVLRCSAPLRPTRLPHLIFHTIRHCRMSSTSSQRSSAVRLLVLETDEPHPDDHREKGSLGEILHRHFRDAGRAHDPPLAVETDQVFVVTDKGGRVPSLKDFDGVHAVLITGSMYDAHGDNPWILELLDRLKGESAQVIHRLTE